MEKLHNEELHNLYSSPSIIRMIKSRYIGIDPRIINLGTGWALSDQLHSSAASTRPVPTTYSPDRPRSRSRRCGRFYLAGN
jgi:hypothetical protein